MRVPLAFLPIFCCAQENVDEAGLLQATNFVTRFTEVDANGAPKVVKDGQVQVFDDGLAHVAVDSDGEAKSEPTVVMLEDEDLEEDDDMVVVNQSHVQRAYVPGTPGAPWSKEEILQVKAKLYRFFSPQEFSRVIVEMYPNGHPFRSGELWRDGPSPAKMLRLTFHDCLKYEDGTGGCDGCIHWDGMGARYSEPAYGGDGHEVPPPHTDNNGLAGTVMALEKLYTEAEFPENTPMMALSLSDSGKSRADLWAFAALMAVEYTIEMNNLACDEVDYPYKSETCMRFAGEPTCKAVKPREFEFRTGRSDCVTDKEQPYMATQKEIQPWAESDGAETWRFMKEAFGFNGRETIASFGAHTLGRLHYPHSLFRYTWTAAQGNIFNNQYYRNIVGKPDWFFEAADPDCTKIGGAYGEPPRLRWVPHVRGDTTTGGPVQWIGEKHTCPNCHKDVDDPCCADRPEGTYCHPDNGREAGTDPVDADDDFNRGCERFRFVNGLDETAIPAEMGLYLNFQVTEEGYPFGCLGLESFNPEGWGSTRASEMHSWMTWSRIDQVRTEPICDKNTMRDPEDDLPFHEIFELYADDQTAWIADFYPALEKMVSSGYGHENLQLSEVDVGTSSVCTQQDPDDTYNQDWLCWYTPDLSEEFELVSKVDGRVLQMNEASLASEVSTLVEGDQSQLWRLSRNGKYFVNSLTGKHLKHFWHSHSDVQCSAFEWRQISGGGQYDGAIICTDTLWDCEKALDRGFEQEDGMPVGLHPLSQHAAQQWEMRGSGAEHVLGPPRTEFDRASICTDAIPFDLSRVIVNNIQTRGPNHADPPVMRFDHAAQFEGKDIDLVVSVNNCGINKIYNPKKSAVNGVFGEGMVQLNFFTNTATTFRFTFVESGSDIKITLPMVAFTVHDFDEGNNGKSREYASVCGAAATERSTDSEVHETSDPHTSSPLANTFVGADCVQWSSTTKGNGKDGAMSSDPSTWTPQQKNRAASFVMVNKAEFDFSFAMGTGFGGRNAIFSADVGLFCEG